MPWSFVSVGPAVLSALGEIDAQTAAFKQEEMARQALAQQQLLEYERVTGIYRARCGSGATSLRHSCANCGAPRFPTDSHCSYCLTSCQS
jgi:hypothetical protein